MARLRPPRRIVAADLALPTDLVDMLNPEPAVSVIREENCARQSVGWPDSQVASVYQSAGPDE
ncbi:hypothetical protein ASPCADRAFT_206419 [Aspergillus carbonarius ITEM 5010]|uniref:Uncharacterized protein n=1 Tax=Aspergillus carbonarius (strain ITEM 5010) TaxID=602072 RepID=A0A1R3RT46_ASPC5|nr:hypothetical protein ASPCADRAFT_206419 [Aspergillus carbonarius ITEM 5010]